MSEINKPLEPTYYLAHGTGVRHSGITQPDQVTTTGQPNLISDADARQFATDVDVANVADFNPLPEVGERVEQGSIYTYQGKTLVCYQSHNQMHYDPFETPALFGKAKAPNEPWRQPLGAHDAYRIGDEVAHNSKNWRSLIAANVWEPGSVGSGSLWLDITVVVPTVPAWVQPTGAQDAYAIGNRVTHDNPNDASAIWVYESSISENTTQPGRDGTFDRWWTPIERV